MLCSESKEVDQVLLGIEWDGHTYTDQVLSFLLRSAPKILPLWWMHLHGCLKVLHFLDNFFSYLPGNSTACQEALAIVPTFVVCLGLVMAQLVVEGPVTSIQFLVIEIVSVMQQLHLLQEKLIRICSLLAQWVNHKQATKHELQCLIGHLSHVAKVLKPWRRLLHPLIKMMAIPKYSYHKVCLNIQCRTELAWWSAFIQE